MKLLYFAWVREKIGVAEERKELPASVKDVGALIEWLKSFNGGYSAAFVDENVVRVAVNQEYVSNGHKVTNDDEVAFFPPVTGG